MTTLPHLARVDAPLPRVASVQHAADVTDDEATGAVPAARRVAGLLWSPLALRIVLLNLLVMGVLFAVAQWMLVLRPSAAEQREATLAADARLAARVVAAAVALDVADPAPLARALDAAGPVTGTLYVFDAAGRLMVRKVAALPAVAQRADATTPDAPARATLSAGRVPVVGAAPPEMTGADLARSLRAAVQGGTGAVGRSSDPVGGGLILGAAVPVRPGNAASEVVVVTAPIAPAAVVEVPEALLRGGLIAGGVALSVLLSLFLAASITGPLRALAAAAEQGRDRHARKMTRSRIRIPDLAERTDEIGRLSKAMRGMVAALYDRIDANEQFAADVTHEIKNPLASLRAAVGTLRVARRDDQRDRLLDVIEHDVRRLDRLVSDISNASRLDSDLVREESVRFNLLKTLGNLAEHMAGEAGESGVEFIPDLPVEPIMIDGLEGRLAQVFVNLLSNAISFCDEGDAVRLWARRRDNRVLIVVEDTGPGIPEAALGKVFERFYSERPDLDFGNHSGLGLAISKQIVEAHGGVIWAENIRPTHADITSEPLGARFVVGLPV